MTNPDTGGVRRITSMPDREQTATWYKEQRSKTEGSGRGYVDSHSEVGEQPGPLAQKALSDIEKNKRRSYLEAQKKLIDEELESMNTTFIEVSTKVAEAFRQCGEAAESASTTLARLIRAYEEQEPYSPREEL